MRLANRSLAGAFAAALTVVAMSDFIGAQWLNHPTAGIPRAADGKADLSAPAPRLADGRLDLSGLWRVVDPKWARDLAADLKPADVSFQSWAEREYKRRMDNNGKDEPDARCLPRGVPKAGATGSPWKVFQNPGVTVILYETMMLYRQIFTDGRELPQEPSPSWLGYSVGRWEGDTLTVHTVGFNGKTWLDFVGHPTTDRLHVVERFRRPDFGHLSIEVTIDYPGAYTRPWTTTEHFRLLPDTELLEYVCNENNKVRRPHCRQLGCLTRAGPVGAVCRTK